MAAPGFSTPPRRGRSINRDGLSVTAAKSGLESFHTSDDRQSIVRTDIVLPWRKAEPPTLAFTLDNVFTLDECQQLIRLTEAVGYGQALVNTGGGRQQLMTDVRNNTRCMVDDVAFADILFQRIAPFLPASYDAEGYRSAPMTCALACLNERLRFLKYTSGQKFAPHHDGMYMRSPTVDEPIPERSFVTVQLYLNGGLGEDFTGGSTAFLRERFRWDGELSMGPGDVVHCEPKAGRVLCFQHNLLHQGTEVSSGTKYCLRTDAMFQPPKSKISDDSNSSNGNQATSAAKPASAQ